MSPEVKPTAPTLEELHLQRFIGQLVFQMAQLTAENERLKDQLEKIQAAAQ